MVDKYGMWEIKLTPIKCCVCGFIGKGRYANRSTVCYRCRRKQRKVINNARIDKF